MGWPLETRHLTISPAASDSISFISFMASTMQITWPFSTWSPGIDERRGAGRRRAVERADNRRLDEVQAGVRIGGWRRAHGAATEPAAAAPLAAATRTERAAGAPDRPRPSLRLVELEPDLQVAPVQVELGNLIFLQEIDQFLQILDILWLHSFLNSPCCAGRDPASESVQSSISALGAESAPARRFASTATISSMRMPNLPAR